MITLVGILLSLTILIPVILVVSACMCSSQISRKMAGYDSMQSHFDHLEKN
jgi:hypothetical protein